uniref:Uncharacterized protein n=1 Tax=Anopheles coluzzii TaxID=1518534 RepID=A0A8W7PV28_ANOCL
MMQNALRRSSVFMRCWRASSSNCSLYWASPVEVEVVPGFPPVFGPASLAPSQADPTSHHLPRSGIFTMSSMPMLSDDTYLPLLIMPLSSLRKCSTSVGSYWGILLILSGAFAAFFCIAMINSFSASGSSLRRINPTVRSTSRMHSTAFSLKHSISFCITSCTILHLTMSNVYRWHISCTQLSSCFASFGVVSISPSSSRNRPTIVSRNCEPTSPPTLACSMATSSMCSSTIRSGVSVGTTVASSMSAVSVLFMSCRAFCMYRLSSVMEMRCTFDSANRLICPLSVRWRRCNRSCCFGSVAFPLAAASASSLARSCLMRFDLSPSSYRRNSIISFSRSTSNWLV